MDCLNNWDCIDACYSRDVLQGFSKCKCFDEIPVDTNDFLTILSENVELSHQSNNLAYVTNINGGYQEKIKISIFFIIRMKYFYLKKGKKKLPLYRKYS